MWPELTLHVSFSDLAPASTYSFKIKAWNRLGDTEWSEKMSASTADAPLDHGKHIYKFHFTFEIIIFDFLDIKKPDQSVYDSNTQTLEVRPTLDPGKYCLLVSTFSVFNFVILL